MDDPKDRDTKPAENPDEIEILLTEKPASEIPALDRPKNLKWLGQKHRNLPEIVYFHADAVTSIWKHCAFTQTREIGGILVGKVYENNGKYAIITASIAAKGANEKIATLTFTHTAWTLMLKEMDQKYPGSVVIGWYHTHPGYGVFLSGLDMHIHKNFFGQPHQVALVVDTTTAEFGLFQWHNDKLEQCSGFPIYGNDTEIKQSLFQLEQVKKLAKKPHAVHVQTQMATQKLKTITEITNNLGNQFPDDLKQDLERVTEAYRQFTAMTNLLLYKLGLFLNEDDIKSGSNKTTVGEDKDDDTMPESLDITI
jgi:proteasome lid subunit RPN8/RPN11